MQQPLVALADVAPPGIGDLGVPVIAGLLAGVIALVLVIRWAMRRGKDK
jgi:hypothetical protein